MNLPEGSNRANIAFADREVCTAVGYCIVRGSAWRRLGLDPCIIAAVRPTKCCRGSHPLAAEDEGWEMNGNGAESKGHDIQFDGGWARFRDPDQRIKLMQISDGPPSDPTTLPTGRACLHGPIRPSRPLHDSLHPFHEISLNSLASGVSLSDSLSNWLQVTLQEIIHYSSVIDVRIRASSFGRIIVFGLCGSGTLSISVPTEQPCRGQPGTRDCREWGYHHRCAERLKNRKHACSRTPIYQRL